MEPVSDIAQQLKTAVDLDRADIVRSILSTLQQNNKDILQSVLSELNNEEGTLLHLAAKSGKTDIVRALLSAGADPGIHNAQGKTAFDLSSEFSLIITVFNEELLQATAQSNVGRVCQLLASGVNVNLSDSAESGNTPLHWAASYGSAEMVQCLCARGAVVDTLSGTGYTPLHDAVRRKDLGVVRELLVHGADPNLSIQTGKDKDKTAITLTTDAPEIVELLKDPPPVVEPEQTNTELHIGDKLVGNSGNKDPDQTPPLNAPNGVIPNGPVPESPQLKTPTFMRSLSYNQDEIQQVVTEEKMGLLWPQPQHILQKDGNPFSPQTPNVPVYVSAGPSHSCRDIIKQLNSRKEMFEFLGYELEVDTFTPLSDTRVPHILCHVNQRLCPLWASYKLIVSSTQLKVICGDLNALHSAISTIYQLFLLYFDEGRTTIPPILVDDWPDITYRGVLLDISMGRLSSMDVLKTTVEYLALLKINQIHLFCRFSTQKTPKWQLVYSKSALMEFENHCIALGIQVIPILEVAPLVQFEDIEELYDVFQDFLSCFPDSQFVSLGPRLSSFVLDTEEGQLDITDCVKMLPLSQHHTIQLCGYPLHELNTELVQQLPPNVVINEYGIQADYDFRRFCRPLSDLGINFSVCPGTASWNSFSGCPEAAVNNIYRAAKCAVNQGAIGMVTCNWSGKGHLTHQPFSWPGFLLGAGLGWNSSCHQDYLYSNLSELMNRYVFRDVKSTVGHVIVELGRAETYLIRCARGQSGNDCQRLPDDQGSTLFQFLIGPDTVPLEHITMDAIQRTMKHVKRCHAELENTDMKCTCNDLILAELQLTCDLMMYATRICRALIVSGRNPAGHNGFPVVNFGISNLPATAKTDLANRLLELLERYKSVWNGRYLEHVGRQESLITLHSLLKTFLPDQETAALLEAKD
ncbi:uncharacterized protein LOC110466050 [Mizuhopecten yessoensis]|uniref:Tankyrase-1 n=1 Tax=Mizuhopecten yessoensis TaxID=6573 RepID=A0A210PQ73_MIZYE|nr:uncharacterized protein LOC110466050 [Mizuhopecten yessoensis]OWF38604.1 Tankyrase-1 [Mizuhopecten yessoensis]